MSNSSRVLAAVALGAAVTVSAAGCQTVDGTASAPSAQVSAYRAEQSASAQVQARADAITLCQQAIPSMAAMVHQYNLFIAALNKSHDYAKVHGLDTKAREQLALGANEIRPKVADSVPAGLADAVRGFLSAGASLNNLIATKRSSELNDVATVWTHARQDTIDLCAHYIPSASVTSKAPVPTSKRKPTTSVPSAGR